MADFKTSKFSLLEYISNQLQDQEKDGDGDFSFTRWEVGVLAKYINQALHELRNDIVEIFPTDVDVHLNKGCQHRHICGLGNHLIKVLSIDGNGCADYKESSASNSSTQKLMNKYSQYDTTANCSNNGDNNNNGAKYEYKGIEYTSSLFRESFNTLEPIPDGGLDAVMECSIIPTTDDIINGNFDKFYMDWYLPVIYHNILAIASDVDNNDTGNTNLGMFHRQEYGKILNRWKQRIKLQGVLSN